MSVIGFQVLGSRNGVEERSASEGGVVSDEDGTEGSDASSVPMWY